MGDEGTTPPSRPSFFKRPSLESEPARPAAPPSPPPPPAPSYRPAPRGPVIPPPPPPPPLPAPGSGGFDPYAQALPRARTRLLFHGTGGSLFGIHVVNVLLTLVTFGVYYFWAKTRVRVYLMSQTELEGSRFAWHGNGRELFWGFLKACGVFGVPTVLLIAIRDLLDVPGELKYLAGILVPLVFVVVLPLAMVGARRYRLSRISWRGIRFSFRGRAGDFVKLFILGSLLSSLTFGLYYPIFEVRRHQFMTEHSWFGNRRFRFDGRGIDMFWPFLVTVLLALPTFGLVLLWYLARKRRYLWDHTLAGEARFHCSVTAVGLFLLYAGNLLLLVLTLGLAWPWAKVRSVRFLLRHLWIEGPLHLDEIQQDARAGSATGEGLAGFFSAGTGFDFG
jgi:uncharacterized membrane protein YjgN (DUF898 family)